MKKILYILITTVLLNSTPTQSQTMVDFYRQLAWLQKGTTVVNDISNFEVEYQAVLNEAVTQGYVLPDIANQRLQNDIVIEMKSNGKWADYKTIHYFKGNGGIYFKFIDWKNPSGTKAFEVGTGNLITSNTGLKGDGVNNLDLDRIATYSLNSASVLFSVTVAGGGAIVEANNTGAKCVSLQGASTFQYFNSDSGNREISNLGGVGAFSYSRNAATNTDISINGVVTETETYSSVILPNESFKLFAGGVDGTMELGYFITAIAINGTELSRYNAINNAPAVTLTGGIQSDGYTPLVLSGNYGTSTAGVFTFDKVSAGITEGVVSDAVATNNRLIMNEAFLAAATDSVFDLGVLDMYVDTGAAGFKSETIAKSLQVNRDSLHIRGNTRATTILRMQPHGGVAGAIFAPFKSSGMKYSKIHFIGEKFKHTYTTGTSQDTHEFPAGIALHGAPDCVIDDCEFTDFTGDGVSVLHSAARNDDGTPAAGEMYTTNLMIKNSTFDANRRNNISYIDADGFTLDNCILKDAGEGGIYDSATEGFSWKGVLPRCNIDFEATRGRGPNCELLETQKVVNGVIKNCTFTGAWIDDLNFYTCYDIEVFNNTFTRALAVPVVSQRLLIHDNILTYDNTQSNYSFGIYLKSYTNTCIPISINGQHEIYNNTITGYDYGIHVTDLGSNIHDNTIVDSNLAGIVTNGIDGVFTNNTITSTVVGSKGYDTTAAASSPSNIVISGGSVNSQLYGARVRNATAVGVAGITYDGVTFLNSIYIDGSDNITIKNSTYPSLTQSGSTNITLTNNNP